MIITYSGKMFDYNNIDIDSIDFEDIFHSLTRINRFIGHSTRAYSVAEHSLYCYLMACKLGYTTKQKLDVFMHDFTEAYVGDCPSPLKKLLPQFNEIEKNVELAILEKLKMKELTNEEHQLVKKIDLTMLAIEMRDLTHHDHTKFFDEDIHMDMIKDEDFNLLKLPLSNEKQLFEMLKVIFTHLIEKYRKEEENEV